MAAYRYQGEPGPKKSRMGLEVKPAPDLKQKVKTAAMAKHKNANMGGFRGNSQKPVTKKPTYKPIPIGGAAGKAQLLQAGGKF